MTAREGCYAPVFGPGGLWCIVLLVYLTTLILIVAIPAAFSDHYRCLLRTYSFHITHCTVGNSDRNLLLQ